MEDALPLRTHLVPILLYAKAMEPAAIKGQELGNKHTDVDIMSSYSSSSPALAPSAPLLRTADAKRAKVLGLGSGRIIFDTGRGRGGPG